jgi:hypothetical protein
MERNCGQFGFHTKREPSPWFSADGAGSPAELAWLALAPMLDCGTASET